MDEHISIRLKNLIDKLGLTTDKFALLTQNNVKNVYNSLKGITNPSYEFIKNVCNNIPKINANWLITGNGSMFLEANTPASIVVNGIHTNNGTMEVRENGGIYKTAYDRELESKIRTLEREIVYLKEINELLKDKLKSLNDK